MNVLGESFYSRDTAEVAKGLLGKTLVRRLDGRDLGGVIVETEAYYSDKDPASRAYQGRKSYNEAMFGPPGRLFIYNVHRYWMLNLVAHTPGNVGAVLIRAIEPTLGVQAMKRNRPVEKLHLLCSGPGRLTLALDVDKSLNGSPVTCESNPVHVLGNDEEITVESSHRVGVTLDLPEKLRFTVKGNLFVSK